MRNFPDLHAISKIAFLALAAALVLLPATLWAATIPVSGACTLGDAITAANTDAATGDCPAGDPGLDTIELTGDVTLDAVLPNIASDVTVVGGGFTVERDPGAPAFRIFEVLPGVTFTLESATVSGGSAGYGGGIRTMGDLIVRDSTISGNSGDSGGGVAVSEVGTATLTHTTISNNSASVQGGGIFRLAGAAELTNCTVSGNQAPRGAGIYSQGPRGAELINSTFSGNIADAQTTISGTGFTATGTLFANSSGANCGEVVDGGGNLADDDSCGAGFGILTGLDPDLADNGGPTKTHALLAGSSAVDGAGDCGLDTDQRGEPRLGGCDSGAFEFGINPPEMVHDYTWHDLGNNGTREMTGILQLSAEAYDRGTVCRFFGAGQ